MVGIDNCFVFAVNLCSDPEDKLKIYRENFEKAYIEATEAFYQVKATQYLQENGVQNYMKYAFAKLREEELRAKKYLEPTSGSIQAVSPIFINRSSLTRNNNNNRNSRDI